MEKIEKLNEPGYENIGTGVFIPKEDAYEYALERIRCGAEDEKQEFVEWFYSGNWLEESCMGREPEEFKVEYQDTEKKRLKRQRQAYEEAEREDRENEYIV